MYKNIYHVMSHSAQNLVMKLGFVRAKRENENMYNLSHIVCTRASYRRRMSTIEARYVSSKMYRITIGGLLSTRSSRNLVCEDSGYADKARIFAFVIGSCPFYFEHEN